MDCSPLGSSVHGILQARIMNSVHFLLQGIFQPRNRTEVCWLWADSLLSYKGSPLVLIALDSAFTTRHIPTGHLSALAQPLHSFWSYFSARPRSIFNTYWSWGLIFLFPIFLPFHTVHGVHKARLLKWFAVPFSSGPHSVRTLRHELSSWWPCKGWLIVSLSIPRHFSFVIQIMPPPQNFSLKPLWLETLLVAINFRLFCTLTSFTYKIIYFTFNFSLTLAC